MGQYYFPILREATQNKTYKDYTLCAHLLNNGLKLTEHSYIRNEFMNCVYNFLIKKPMKVYWMGDYTDTEDIKEGETFLKKMFKLIDKDPNNIPHSITEAETYMGNKYPYILNHTKQEFLDIREHDTGDEYWSYHPLSLLTATSNGKGGGDYYNSQYPYREKYIGIWKGDLLEVSDVTYGYKKVFFELEDKYLEECNDKIREELEDGRIN